MTVQSAKLWLSVGWLAAMAPLVVVLILRQLDGFYGSDAKEVWSWFSQFVLPALTLLAGAWTVAAAPTDQKQIDNTIVFWIAVSMSIFYIVLLYVVIGKQPTSSVPWQEQFKQSALFLGIIQGLVIGVLGKFFIESGR
jgi:ABC-type transport system involved in cytochrome c biogenesis permease subunit